MKKRYYICFFIILFVLIISLILLWQIKNYKAENIMYKSKLSDFLEEYEDNSINILHYDNNYILGTIESDLKDSMLLTTVALFTYNTDTNEFNLIKQENDKRIIDFYITGDKIYYCYISYNSDDSFSWSLCFNNIDSDSCELLLQGTIQNVFEYPRLFGNSNNLFVILKDNNVSQIYQIKNTTLENIRIINNEKISMINMDSTIFYNDKIYYSSTSSNGTDMIIEIHLDTNEYAKIYEATNVNHTIYNYSFLDNNLIIQEVIGEDESILITFNTTTNSIVQTLNTKFLTFPRALNNNIILFHSSGNIWEKYDVTTNTIDTINSDAINSSDIFPKYTVIGTNIILIQKFNNDFYVVSL